MKLSIKEMVIFSMLGAIMYASKVIMEVLPNIHLLGMLTITYTLCYGKKALYPIYTYVFLNGLFCGFSMWWIPYLYIWTILWGVIMLLPKNMPTIVYMIICALHGFLFGTLYAPAQALFFGLDFNGTIAWIISGLYFDMIHGISNFFVGSLITPLVHIIRRIDKAHY